MNGISLTDKLSSRVGSAISVVGVAIDQPPSLVMHRAAFSSTNDTNGRELETLLLAKIGAIRGSVQVHPVRTVGLALVAHDPANHLVAIGVAPRRLGQVAPVEQRHHPIADIEDVVHAMANEDHADAMGLEILHQVEHL